MIYILFILALSFFGCSDNDPVSSSENSKIKKGMVLISSGFFVDGNGDTAYISTDFYMDTTEVTQVDYDSVMSNGTYGYSGYSSPRWSSTDGIGTNFPAYHVNWFDVVLYCNARSKRDSRDTVYIWTSISGIPGNDCVLQIAGVDSVVIDYTKNGYRLPTADAWELAARAGQQLEHPTDNGALDIAKANYDYNIDKTTVVGSYPANPYGLYDMAGNLYEWCNDWYGSTGRVNNRTDYTGEVSNLSRVRRGGGWNSIGATLHSAYRGRNGPSHKFDNVGFRVVCPAP